MSDNGYVYVLMNPSMENLVKIGKTNRDPIKRAEELSSTTGVPTPFVVVYDNYFENCSDAESFVHTLLESRGYRISKHREFFEVPLKEAIDAVISAKEHYDSSGKLDTIKQSDEDELFSSNAGNNFLDSLNIEEEKTEPWREMFEIAEMHYYGLEDRIVDYEEAMKYYLKAAKLGSINSYRKIGRMYKDGEGVKTDIKNALRYFKEGAKKGDVSCYGEMGALFQEENSLENAEKCWKKYFELAPYIDPFLAFYYVGIGVRVFGLKLQYVERLNSDVVKIGIMQLQLPREVKDYIKSVLNW